MRRRHLPVTGDCASWPVLVVIGYWSPAPECRRDALERPARTAIPSLVSARSINLSQVFAGQTVGIK